MSALRLAESRPAERPRERLLGLGPSALTLVELLAIVIGTGTWRADARAVAEQLLSVAGGDESGEFRRQNRLIRETWGEQHVPICEELPGLNHFSVLDALIQPGHRLNDLALQLLS